MEGDLYKLYALSCMPLSSDSFVNDLDDLDDDDMTEELVVDELKIICPLLEASKTFINVIDSSEGDDKKAALSFARAYLKRLSSLTTKLAKICTVAEKAFEGEFQLEQLDAKRTARDPVPESFKAWGDTSNFNWASPLLAEKKKKKEAPVDHTGKKVQMAEAGEGQDLEKQTVKMRKGTGFIKLTPKQLGLESSSDEE